MARAKADQQAWSINSFLRQRIHWPFITLALRQRCYLLLTSDGYRKARQAGFTYQSRNDTDLVWYRSNDIEADTPKVAAVFDPEPDSDKEKHLYKIVRER